MSRPVITLLSFPVLLLLYFLYGWVIVPFVLPDKIKNTNNNTIIDYPVDGSLQPFVSLFKDGDWELNLQPRPKFLKNGNIIILFQEESIVQDIVRLQPCTFIVLPEDEKLSQEEQCQRAIVMRTNEVAEVQFTDAVNFSKFPFPKMTGGRLLGKVTITSGMKEIGTQDDLFIETSDIAIDDTPEETLIYAIKDSVKFRLGYSTGEGSRMTISMKNNKKNDQKKSQKEFAVLRLDTVKFLNLVFPEKPKDNKNKTTTPLDDIPNEKIATPYPNQKTQSETQKQFTFNSDEDPSTKFDIHCQREFIFETDERNGGWTAGFNGNVEVVRTNPDASQDFLNGELLHINFQPEQKTTQNQTNNKTQTQPQNQNINQNISLTDSGNLQPAKMEVFGKPGMPARLRSAQGGGLVMEGDRILYDVKENLIAVETALTDNPQEVAGAAPGNPKKKPEASENVKIILQNRYAIQSELGFLYNIGKSGEFGILNSSGKGRLDGLIGNDKNLKKIHLTWNVLQISPEPNNAKKILFDLRGGVTLDVEDFGKMTAEILQLWCNIEDKPPTEKTKPNEKNQNNDLNNNSNSTLVPESAIVLNRVHFENQNGTCDVQRLNIFFSRQANGINVTNITQASMVTIYPQHSAISQASAIEPQDRNGNIISPIRLVQHTELRKRPDQFMPYMPPVIELPRPSGGVKVAQGNTSVAGNRVASGVVNNIAPTTTSGSPNANANANVPQIPQPEIKNVRTQNLLGFQPGNPHSIYAITGDQMEMNVLQTDRASQVQRLWIGGNVRIVEKVEPAAGSDLVEITGEEVYVWYPSTPNTVIYITGKDTREAIFTGKGAQIRAMNVYIFRAENVIKIVGPGRLLADAKSKKSENNAALNQNNQTPILPATTQLDNSQFEQNKRNEGDNRILVQWNKEMYFDGNIISFKGIPDKNGNRVLALMEDRELRCNMMQIFTNRYVSLFDDKSKVTIKPERVGCAIDVVAKSEKFENGVRKSFDWAEFDAVEIRLETDEFFAKGPGLIRSTFLESDNMLSDQKGGYDVLAGLGSGNAKSANNNSDTIMFLCIWFYDHIQGVSAKTHKSATMKGHIDAVLCPVSTWDERIERDQLNVATKRGYLLKCEELRMVQIPDPVQKSKNFVELTAIDNATIEGENRSLYGRAQTIKYNQSKSQVMLEGNELNNARITTSSQGTIPAHRIEYNIKTGTTKIVNLQSIKAGN
ncbi:MAG: LptA/OstA family protein [Planctomycetaceae bacterium]|nr:LptA/OstA family protein [Planctomycetaceae bacterium]